MPRRGTANSVQMTGDYRVIHDARDNYGHYFEEFSPGDVYKHWPGKTITEADNHIFTLLTMNTNPLHIDEEYMSRHQHGKILVVGPLVLSLVVGMSVPDTSGKAIANLEYERIRHEAPRVPWGHHIRRERNS